MKTIMVTGGCGFIGSNFIRFVHGQCPDWHILNLDALTYAANPYSLTDIQESERYTFEHADLSDPGPLNALFERYKPDRVFHLAAESHVDRSIVSPDACIQSNIIGTFNLLEAARTHWSNPADNLLVHVSTDEVYGSLGKTGHFTESSPYAPSSPYSASKASGDHLVQAYHRTYGLPVMVTHCSNNYGPRQFPEKLIPLMILNAAEGKPLPVYGDGSHVRDWLEVTDHCRALLAVAQHGTVGQTYNIGGDCERSNLQVVEAICRGVEKYLGKESASIVETISFVKDRPGHDFRYAIDSTRVQLETGWRPSVEFEEGIENTIAWYLENPTWVSQVQTGAYRQWMELNYTRR